VRDANASLNRSRLLSILAGVATAGVLVVPIALPQRAYAAVPAAPFSSNPSGETAKPAAPAALAAVREVKFSPRQASAEIFVQVDGKLDYNVAHLSSPERIVVDFHGARLATKGKTALGGVDPITQIRMSQFAAGIVRLVVDLREPVPYEVHAAEGGIVMRLGREADAPAGSKPVDATAELASTQPPAATGDCADTDPPETAPSASVLTSVRNPCADAVLPTGTAAASQDAQKQGQKPFADQQPQPARATRPQKNKEKVELNGVNTRWRTYELDGVPQYGYHVLDPYHQNRIKGDFPMFGDRWFTEVDVFQTFVYKSRRNVDFTQEFNGGPNGQKCFHSSGEECVHNNFIDENGIFGFEIRHNDDRFFPADFRIHMDGIADFKHDPVAVDAQSAGNAEIFDAFSDVQLANFGTHNFNQMFLRGGLQAFKSDFHGLIFNDTGLGGRIFGQALKNRLRYDVVYLKLFARNAVSGLFDFRIPSQHQVVITRFTWEDFLVKGWNSEWSFHVNHDPRKANTGNNLAALNLDTYYLGATFNGNLGRFIFNPAFYGVVGTADHNDATVSPAAAVQHDVRAWTGVIDLEYPIDFLKFRFGYVYASGASGNLSKKTDTGFDAISDAVVLFGGPFSYWVGEDIKFGNGDLVRPNSFFPSLRGINAQANYDNPGLQLSNLGMDVTVTQRLNLSFNFNNYYFNSLGQFPGIGLKNNKNNNIITIAHNEAAIEENVFLRWKPLLHQINDLFVIDMGFSVMQPLAGLHDMFGRSTPVYTIQAVPRLVF